MAAAAEHRSRADTAATIVLGVLAALAAAASVLISPFFVMATDSCGPDNCKMSRIALAYVVTWGGVVLAVLVAVVGIVRAARRHRRMWPWPAAAVATVATSFVLGALLAVSVTA